ncbi:hypothetical protein [Flammeovirga sp. SJP92]|uniref:hypothetical protein n=1 Tax=Flammeovirga sp. SJP92 TaxID=1775430 RepID=UPI000788B35C|nr:hypothetical protein [Flammeovirga sp. SJP92]KXX67820.1 hypothetical protein AVL50_25495 [Flammeovirga sp. SJP92]
MKNLVQKFAAISMLASVLVACNNNDETTEGPSQSDGEILAAKLTEQQPIAIDGSATGWTPGDWAVDVNYPGTDVSDVTADNADGTLPRNINSDLTLEENSTWILAGGVHVRNGATLTIEPGVRVVDLEGEDVAYLMVEQGGKIEANGTAENMIVFTSQDQVPGSWGGIIINGYAPINVEGGKAHPEVGTGIDGEELWYGGDNPSDDSGSLSYIRLEFGGNEITTDKEHNGFTFNGVGNQTECHHLQAHKGDDDGFEWFGGTANASFLVSTDNKDDQFDWTEGWTGTLENAYAHVAEGCDRGFEGDNNSQNHEATPYSHPTLKNITVIAEENGSDSQGFKIRVGSKVTMENVIVKGFPTGVSIEHDVTLEHVDNTYNGDADDFKVTNLNVSESLEKDIEYKASRQ